MKYKSYCITFPDGILLVLPFRNKKEAKKYFSNQSGVAIQRVKKIKYNKARK